MPRRSLRRLVGALVLASACWPATAAAVDLEDPGAQWLPRSDGAQWTYAWSNSAYLPAPLREQYDVTARTGTAFRVSWQTVGQAASESPGAGFADYRQTDAGLVNTLYRSTPAPPQFPLLCSTADQCGNSLAATHFLLIWGMRSPVLAEPLMRGTHWNALGGAESDVASTNRYLGRETVAVPAFPRGVPAAKVESDVSQAGALGDPFGSGLRTVWWVYGVGPVKIVFQHAGGERSTAELQSTTLAPLAMPSDANPFPLDAGKVAHFRWRNNRHMRKWSRQRVEIAQVVNNTARIDVEDTSGPIDVDASYVFVSRLGGVTNLSSVWRKGSTSAWLPRLGPRGGVEGRRRFLTPYDLMSYGYNPVIPAYAAKGDTWRSSRDTRDWRRYGVLGVSRVLGARTVKTPAGRFSAIAVRSTLRQPGRRFGTGTRTSYFVSGRGLVKLVFRHDDGSVSTVERVR